MVPVVSRKQRTDFKVFPVSEPSSSDARDASFFALWCMSSIAIESVSIVQPSMISTALKSFLRF